ncbi:MBL fold metallo-hydrolase [Microbacterium sp. RD1]|uniref:MBL fold metallo-hydrolase n=1 Tax=Microbacterium sp. RD1 TaxID=3457313 RepID=UPI003FA5DE24
MSGLTPVLGGLSATGTAPLPFLAGVVVRSFLLRRPRGNLLVYNAPGIDAASADISAAGAPERLLINHWHEAMYPAPRLEVPIWVHEDDRARTARALPIAGTFAGPAKLDDDIEVVPTPGHTDGATAYVWDDGAHRFLFVGDTIWVHRGRWQVVLLGESDRTSYLDSLRTLRDVEFDVLVPWGADADGPAVFPVSRSQARDEITALIRRVEAGASE